MPELTYLTILLLIFQSHEAATNTEIHEEKRLQSNSDPSSILHSPKTYFDFKTILSRISNLEEMQLANTRQIAELEHENSVSKQELKNENSQQFTHK